jgi:hypothetical protein
MVTVTHKVNQRLEVSLTVANRPTPPLNLDQLINHEVMQATDPRVFRSLLGHWIYAEETLAKSCFERIGMLKNQTP